LPSSRLGLGLIGQVTKRWFSRPLISIIRDCQSTENSLHL
jgi:hypothetical protein